MYQLNRPELVVRYLCEAVQGQHGVYMPESLHHMLIMCPNVKMEALRVKLKADLLLLCATERRRPPRAPPSGAESVGDVVAFDAVYNKREFSNASTPEREAA